MLAGPDKAGAGSTFAAPVMPDTDVMPDTNDMPEPLAMPDSAIPFMPDKPDSTFPFTAPSSPSKDDIRAASDMPCNDAIPAAPDMPDTVGMLADPDKLGEANPSAIPDMPGAANPSAVPDTLGTDGMLADPQPIRHATIESPEMPGTGDSVCPLPSTSPARTACLRTQIIPRLTITDHARPGLRADPNLDSTLAVRAKPDTDSTLAAVDNIGMGGARAPH
ncbi:hypothetical protein PHYSODRAFT_326589 [Phytophthora sojae]|uniref:Uncharacterized protein n=1 Tax=Phytophthora sojae (strain P6497) TaxID=1094619 RepID=G4YWF1_PHYSP|nr:hypothetical protein PHYSODRAFT_326589 [Phytophthora sojae]EGZ25597.1 hypothetical protein PHYSODRAFT_326589 [Phytophthora sojae]|eukprot:XP_009520885.1 hypothetical protein PHYSODRAFT_326589 [Phytophthora sojae]